VKAGDVLGYVGSAALGEMKCLHFELWRLGEDSHFEPVESLGYMNAWRMLPWTDERLTPIDAAILKEAA
jgi:murein DD-endopeptidase MepM/ murein hydrolase activator NlpD